MRLKRLEMIGFKSFAEKTQVDFEAGITGVVGPNGCGKSNISDSIRWALGEMSAKTLRSQQMMDVVFNGTAKRPAQNMAEVSLTFDNSDKRLPLDYSEVTVSRRLFRSGESEYFMNKTQCRLKDIRDLFMDTGVGNDGYYVMQQGRVEFILSAKPEERRELFEEAAGVAKYKSRREEALRRLGKVDQDMTRLNDSLAIYKQQIDSLDAAVRKAQKAQELQQEVRKLEIGYLLQTLQTHEQALLERQAALEQSKTELGQLELNFQTDESTLREKRRLAESLEQAVLELQKKTSEVENELTRIETESRTSAERLEELEKSRVRLSEEAQTVSKQIEEGKAEHDRLSSEIATLQSDFKTKQAHFQQIQEQFHLQEAKNRHLRETVDGSKNHLTELARQIAQQRNETVRLASSAIRQEEVVNAKARELEKIRSKQAALTEQLRSEESAHLEVNTKVETLELQLKESQASQHADEEQVLTLEQDIQNIRERLARLGAEKVSLERWLQQDPMAKAVLALEDLKLNGIYGPVSDLFKVSSKYERIRDRALGDRAQFFVAESLADAQEAIRYLSENRKGWATFILLDRVREATSVTSWDPQGEVRSLAEVVSCEERFRPVLAYLLGHTYCVGSTVFEEGLMRGGAEPAEEGYQATPLDLSRLRNEISTLEQQLGSSITNLDVLKKHISERKAQQVELRDEVQKVQVLNQVQREKRARLQDEVSLAEKEIHLLEQEQTHAQAAIQESQQKVQELEIVLTSLEKEEMDLKSTLTQNETSQQSFIQELQAMQRQVADAQLQLETTKERLRSSERERDALAQQLERLNARQLTIQTETNDHTQKISDIQNRGQNHTVQIQELQGKREASTKDLSDQLSQRQSLFDSLRNEERAIDEKRQVVQTRQRSLQEVEFALRATEQERQRLEALLLEQFQMTPSDARAQIGDLTVLPEELQRSKRRLENLGAVNMAAPEEYAQLQERFQFLNTQQQDLAKAKEDLLSAITKINETTRDQFQQTFDVVRANFKQLYQTLFNGGEADLILTDASNILETGIEIMAQPPGKKLQNITLLSGGEKALTAIALLFAFFMVKPSPFCLLDEVDAPLDEANVGRYLQMVKSFSDNTQFIMITHNKRTMEMADVIYGVTMAELGVSSLISMKMEARKPEEAVVA